MIASAACAWKRRSLISLYHVATSVCAKHVQSPSAPQHKNVQCVVLSVPRFSKYTSERQGYTWFIWTNNRIWPVVTVPKDNFIALFRKVWCLTAKSLSSYDKHCRFSSKNTNLNIRGKFPLKSLWQSLKVFATKLASPLHSENITSVYQNLSANLNKGRG